MKISKAFCFFEQSGTFRDEFRKLGIQAEDYDIKNDFGKTDHVTDLFAEINAAFDGKPSVFDEVGPDDLIFAFFPCVRFSKQMQLLFRGENFWQKNISLSKKLELDLEYHKELHELYMLITKLALVCIRRKIRLVIENPCGDQHYLTTYWALKPVFIDKDRMKNGDYYKKPTQYFFVNCDPEENFIWEPVEYTQPGKIELIYSKKGLSRETIRSMIAPQYANRFIKTYLL